MLLYSLKNVCYPLGLGDDGLCLVNLNQSYKNWEYNYVYKIYVGIR